MKFNFIFLFFFILTPTILMADDEPSQQQSAERKIDKVYYENGDLYSETNLFSDRNNGFYKTYHHNGQLASLHTYQNGKEILDKAFDPKGNAIIRNGIFSTHYADGTRECSGNYHNDLKDGEFKCYFYDGKTVVDVWHYLKGYRAGLHIRNDEQGRLVYAEDLGYPSFYVQELKNLIMALSAVLLMFVLAFIFYKKE